MKNFFDLLMNGSNDKKCSTIMSSFDDFASFRLTAVISEIESEFQRVKNARICRSIF